MAKSGNFLDGLERFVRDAARSTRHLRPDTTRDATLPRDPDEPRQRGARGGSFTPSNPLAEQIARAAGPGPALDADPHKRTRDILQHREDTKFERANERARAGKPRPDVTSRKSSGGNPAGMSMGLGLGLDYTGEYEDKPDAQERRDRSAGRDPRYANALQNSDAAWSRLAKTRELTDLEWNGLTEPQKRQIEFNTHLMGVLGEDRRAGNTEASDDLFSRIGLDEDDISRQHFASGQTAVRESDILGDSPALIRPSKFTPTTDRNNLRAWGTSDSAEGQRAQMMAKISEGIERYFQDTGGTFGTSDAGTLDGVLGSNFSGAGVPAADPVLEEIFTATASRGPWEAGGTYEDVLAELDDRGVPKDVFDQYVGMRVAEAQKKRQPLLIDTDDSLDVDEYVKRMGLTGL